MSRLSRDKKRDQQREATPIDVRVPLTGESATVAGTTVTAPAGEELHQAVLTHLHHLARTAGHPVHATIHDARIGYVVPLEIATDGASRFTAEPWRMPPPPPSDRPEDEERRPTTTGESSAVFGAPAGPVVLGSEGGAGPAGRGFREGGGAGDAGSAVEPGSEPVSDGSVERAGGRAMPFGGSEESVETRWPPAGGGEPAPYDALPQDDPSATHRLRDLSEPRPADAEPPETRVLRQLPDTRTTAPAPGTVVPPTGEFGPPPVMNPNPTTTPHPALNSAYTPSPQPPLDDATAPPSMYPGPASAHQPPTDAAAPPRAYPEPVPASAPQPPSDATAPRACPGPASTPQPLTDATAPRAYPEPAPASAPQPPTDATAPPRTYPEPASAPQPPTDATAPPRTYPGPAPAPAPAPAPQPPTHDTSPRAYPRSTNFTAPPQPLPSSTSTPTPRPAPLVPLLDDPGPQPTPVRGFDAVAEAVLGDGLVVEDVAVLGGPVGRISEAVREGRTDTAAELAEETVTQASRTLGAEHPDVLRVRELAAYIAYLGGEPVQAAEISLDLAGIHHRAGDAEAAYGNVQSAATAWKAVRDPLRGLALGSDLLALWTEMAAGQGPAADEPEKLESARSRMLRLAERARNADA